MMKYIHGVDMGPVRCPISTVPDETFEKVKEALAEIEFKAKCL